MACANYCIKNLKRTNAEGDKSRVAVPWLQRRAEGTLCVGGMDNVRGLHVDGGRWRRLSRFYVCSIPYPFLPPPTPPLKLNL